jgi:hypothetical protein
MEFTVFDEATGICIGHGSDPTLELNYKVGDIIKEGGCVSVLGIIYPSTKGWKNNEVVDFSKKELAQKNSPEDMRLARNKKLQESDYIFNSDIDLTEEKLEEWKTYRKALRDLPNHSSFPYLTEDDWPIKPE